MAIHFIYGAPGSGKTYYAVNHLLSHYYDYDKENDHYNRKSEFEDLKIVTNIDGFQPDHIILEEWIMHAGSADKFFSYATQEKIHKKYGSVVYLIDEAHQYFPSTFKDQQVLNWFSYHRHWGQTIYIMSQSHSRISRQITDMVEMQVKALPASTTLLAGKDLKYNIMSGREVVDRKAIIKNKRIFAQYRSQSSNTKEKTKNPLIKYIVGCAVIAGLLFYNAVRWASDFGQHDESVSSIESVKTPQQVFNHHKRIKVIEKKKEIKQPELTKIPVSISWAKYKNRMVIFYQNRMYQAQDFPYQIAMNGKYDMIALIPEIKTQQEQINTNQIAVKDSQESFHKRNRLN